MTTKELKYNAKAKTDQLTQCMPAELREKDDGDTGITIKAYGRATQILRAKIARLTGHDYHCEISIDPIYKPCTCGRG